MVLPHNKKRRFKGRSKGMQKRVAKLEEQIVPIIKTFEQRQYDFRAAAAPTYDGTPLTYSAPVVFRSSDLFPTQQSSLTPSGANLSQVRLGDKITLKSMRMKGEVRACFSGVATAESSNIVRLILVQFPQGIVNYTNAEVCSIVLQDYPTQTGGPINSVMALHSHYKNVISVNNSQPMRKYKVLADKTFRLSNPAKNGSYNGNERWRQSFKIDKFWKEGLVCQYDKPLSEAPTLNSIALICLSDSTVAPHPDITLASRTKYMDA